MSTIKAVYLKTRGDEVAKCFELRRIPKPEPGADDLLVKIEACAINPVDIKVRRGEVQASDVTCYDAAGVVEAVGWKVKSFKPGDEVYYICALGRQGSTAQYNLVDHRVAAIKPNVDWVTAASIPLVGITAWELLNEQFGLGDSLEPTHKSILIIDGANAVGSMVAQLASTVFNLKNVIVTASGPKTIKHATETGATHVIDDQNPLKEQLRNIGIESVNYVVICHSTNEYLDQAVEIAAPFGRIGSIAEVSEHLNGLHKPSAVAKSLSFHWECAFAKTTHNVNLRSQGYILRRIAELYNARMLQSLVHEVYSLSVANLVKAHTRQESGNIIGKISIKVGSDIQ